MDKILDKNKSFQITSVLPLRVWTQNLRSQSYDSVRLAKRGKSGWSRMKSRLPKCCTKNDNSSKDIWNKGTCTGNINT